MELIKITKENLKKKPTFEEISKIIKNCESEVVTEVLFDKFNNAEIKLGFDSEDELSITIEDKFSIFNKNGKILNRQITS
ncbi:hypothetical protein [Kaistella sp.]|uniref:hypothetical protein n=1 Tax=Kaistella sp. TaxID=2782235 RepID=UPI003C6555ED